ncbi:hypothetical protein MNBD_UNCLBAC01-272 [hydrothermal vent metagenome]|uniref:Uncharacterized protein n=1 Tax=hydrothermal vent metagenome TaxID=652676 RepID=A0A3B1DT50_9ZZZZ
MTEGILKGNFQVKNPVKLKEEAVVETVGAQLKERALASLGGSMVYMERTDLT